MFVSIGRDTQKESNTSKWLIIIVHLKCHKLGVNSYFGTNPHQMTRFLLINPIALRVLAWDVSRNIHLEFWGDRGERKSFEVIGTLNIIE
jgi:hypothetical protein